jgi:repressor LexA
MNEKQTDVKTEIRPTKKQRELLTFIEAFIAEHGYSPSYREIMAGLNYTSVATVALHVNSLIKRGHLLKRDRSARSLEVVQPTEPAKITTNLVAPAEATGGELPEVDVDQLYVLVGALKVLGLEGAAQSFTPRLAALKKRQPATTTAPPRS